MFRFINGNETGNTSLCGKSRDNQFHSEIINAGVDFFTGHPFVNAVFVIGAYESSVGEFGDAFVLPINQVVGLV